MNSNPGSNKQAIQELTQALMQHQEAMATMGSQINQLQRILWLTVQAAGGQVEIHEGQIPSLWKLEKRRGENNSLILTSAVMEEPPKEKMDALVDRLMNTELDLLKVQKELGLEQYPANFLAFHMSDRLILTEGKWLPNTIAKAAFKQDGQN